MNKPHDESQDTSTPAEAGVDVGADPGVDTQPKWMRISLMVVGLGVLVLVVVLSRG